MICYVDSSVILRNVFGTQETFRDFSAYKKIGASELLVIECCRILDRYRLESALDDASAARARERLHQLTDGMYLIAITDAVKNRAKEAFPTIIGTLDAIHLATALLWGESEKNEPLKLLTHDAQMSLCARALGLSVPEK